MARADPPRRSHPLTFFLHNLKQRPYGRCFFLHLTLYTLHSRIKNIFGIFYVFFFISRRAYIYVYLLSPRPRAYLIYIHAKPTRRQASTRRQAIHAKPTRRQAIHCAYAYTRVARHILKLTLIAATPHHQSDLCTDRSNRPDVPVSVDQYLPVLAFH